MERLNTYLKDKTEEAENHKRRIRELESSIHSKYEVEVTRKISTFESTISELRFTNEELIRKNREMENIAHPRPFLIIKEGTKEHITEVDFTGGYFPKWSHPIYLDAQSPADSENQNWFRIEIWNKERGDRLLGEGGFCVQGGRQQVWVTKGGKKSGYAFVRTEVTRK